MEIPEFKRDDSGDYLFVLKSLNEIPFPVGKKLLVDFLIENYDNDSIEKNKMYDFHNFGSLKFLSRFEVERMVEELIAKRLISGASVNGNKFMKVFGITQAGKSELIEPTLNSKKIEPEYSETYISDEEFAAFKELHEFLEGFNPEQKKAIILEKEKILCVAGAGSGKTTVLTKRIEFLYKKLKVSKDKILAITFTKKAREEMQLRLAKLGVSVKVETFNSFCEKILLKNTAKIYGRRMRVASFQDKMIALSVVLADLNLTINEVIEKYFSVGQQKSKSLTQLQNVFLNDCFAVLDYFKSNKKDFEEFPDNFIGKDAQNAQMIYNVVKGLSEQIKMQGLRTYSDQITDALEFLKKNPNGVPQFDHILVDEFQDVNFSQVELLDLLSAKNLFCVGDPRQSIFGWRGSDISYVLDFEKKYEDCEVIHLKKNYRSSKPIVGLMNSLIRDMKMPDLEHNSQEESLLRLYNFKSEEDECAFIARKILIEDTPREEIFVLARTNKQLQNLARMLDQSNVAYILKTENNPDAQAGVGEVTLATVHSIKGLESELVFVMGCNNMNFPCKVSEHPVMEMVKMYEYDKEAEEKRLFYVAISRAKKKLYLTYTGKKHTYFINEEMQKELELESF